MGQYGLPFKGTYNPLLTTQCLKGLGTRTLVEFCRRIRQLYSLSQKNQAKMTIKNTIKLTNNLSV